MKLVNSAIPNMMAYRRINFLSKTAVLLTGIIFFNVTQAATQHIVESGETVSTIAQYYDIPKTALIDANGLKATDIEIGQLLNIPDKNKHQNLYKVELGDNLTSLAIKYKVEANELARINNLSPESGLLIDSMLVIPASGERINQTSPPKKNVAASDNRQDIVITNKMSTAPDTQAASNAMTDKQGGRYRVKYGDSLSKVAKLYNVKVETLAQINDMNITDPLYFGRYITIPIADPVSDSKKVPNDTTATPPVNIQYAVQAGDTLIGIANKFKSDFIQIATLSGISYNDSLIIGQILTIPRKINNK